MHSGFFGLRRFFAAVAFFLPVPLGRAKQPRRRRIAAVQKSESGNSLSIAVADAAGVTLKVGKEKLK